MNDCGGTAGSSVLGVSFGREKSPLRFCWSANHLGFVSLSFDFRAAVEFATEHLAGVEKYWFAVGTRDFKGLQAVPVMAVNLNRVFPLLEGMPERALPEFLAADFADVVLHVEDDFSVLVYHDEAEGVVVQLGALCLSTANSEVNEIIL